MTKCYNVVIDRVTCLQIMKMFANNFSLKLENPTSEIIRKNSKLWRCKSSKKYILELHTHMNTHVHTRTHMHTLTQKLHRKQQTFRSWSERESHSEKVVKVDWDWPMAWRRRKAINNINLYVFLRIIIC